VGGRNSPSTQFPQSAGKHQFPNVVAACKADSVVIQPTTVSFSEMTFAETNGTVFSPNSVQYTITSATTNAMSGTFTAPVYYINSTAGGTNHYATGSLQGTWQAAPKANPFPKCEPPATNNLYCFAVGGGIGNSLANQGVAVPCIAPFLPLSSPARPGEWIGYP
jgi:hypothetical protein